jgi:hypothetical protein
VYGVVDSSMYISFLEHYNYLFNPSAKNPNSSRQCRLRAKQNATQVLRDVNSDFRRIMLEIEPHYSDITKVFHVAC